MKRQRFLSEFDSAKPVRKQDLELTPDEHLFLEQSQKIEQASMLNSAYLQSRHPSDLMIYPWEEWDDNEEDEKPGSGVAARQKIPIVVLSIGSAELIIEKGIFIYLLEYKELARIYAGRHI
ncbi:hypothetical protein G9A89_010419 [Geosiphon pyriformis]|nr:hypothetical protein G9A89_010419 [Geosiphon pyriformis]